MRATATRMTMASQERNGTEKLNVFFTSSPSEATYPMAFCNQDQLYGKSVCEVA